MTNPLLSFDGKDALVILMAWQLAALALFVAAGLTCWLLAHVGVWR